MDKIAILKDMVIIANELDSRGLVEEADNLSGVIERVARFEEDEKLYQCDGCGDMVPEEEINFGEENECNNCKSKRTQEAKGEWENLGRPIPTDANLEHSNAMDEYRLQSAGRTSGMNKAADDYSDAGMAKCPGCGDVMFGAECSSCGYEDLDQKMAGKDVVERKRILMEAGRKHGYVGVGLISLFDDNLTPEDIEEFRNMHPNKFEGLTDKQLASALQGMAIGR